MQPAILVENLGKRFNRYHSRKPRTFMEAALLGLRQIKAVDQFWALRGVSFEVAAGEMVGIIGHNGSGKSTLLQLLGKVAHPTEGRIKMRGHVGALLDLGAGFHGDLTGRENVFVTAIVAGLSRWEVRHRFDQIVGFAGLEAFINNPTRTYSSGMLMRLAFSVAVHTDPEILLVDEFLSVGDLAFQTKCLNRISAMKEQGCAIVLVSHDTKQVEQLCDRALWLRQGQVVAYGEPEVVAGQYKSEMHAETLRRTPIRPPQLTRSGIELQVNQNRFGSLEAEITDVRLLPTDIIDSGAPLKIEINYLANKPIQSPIFNVSISREDGQICFESNTNQLKAMLSLVSGEGQITLCLDRLDLNGGYYFVDVGIYEQNWNYAYDYHWHTYSLLIQSEMIQTGVLNPPQRWELNNSSVLCHKQ